jgi:hypothetical protein
MKVSSADNVKSLTPILSALLLIAHQAVAEVDQGTNTSALDLSLFGVITLGVVGLFWIRRHTSEL